MFVCSLLIRDRVCERAAVLQAGAVTGLSPTLARNWGAVHLQAREHWYLGRHRRVRIYHRGVGLRSHFALFRHCPACGTQHCVGERDYR